MPADIAWFVLQKQRSPIEAEALRKPRPAGSHATDFVSMGGL